MAGVGQQVFQFFRAHGFSPAQSAGIVGNFQQESSLNPQSSGGGLDQGQGARYHPGSLGHQLQAILGELQGPERGTLQALKGAQTPQQAALIFSQRFERPEAAAANNAGRQRYAAEALHRYGGLAGANISGGEGGTPQSTGTHAGPAKPVEQTAAQSADLTALVSALQGSGASSTSPAGIPVGSAQPGVLAPVRDLGSSSSGPSPQELLALVSQIGQSPTSASTVTPGTPHTQVAEEHPGQYVNPLPGFTKGRTDMGVDYSAKPGQPIRAIGEGIVQPISPNWYEGQPYVSYKLTSGPKAGQTVYVAEQITPQVKAGQRVLAGQRIGVYAPHGTGIETGRGSGTPGQTFAQQQGNTGDATHGNSPAGQQFKSFVERLGAR
jgi:murein DD-endopeptidase MepM/ murein hydrolase activator NlpD